MPHKPPTGYKQYAINRVTSLAQHARMKPRIGLTGSFGRGNYGDELYVKNYQHWFGSWADLHLLTGLPHPYYMQEFAVNRIDLMDAIVMGGGDLLCPYRAGIDHDFINSAYLRKPLHVFGIGVERNRSDILDKTLERWQNFLNAPNVRSISNRDAGSAEWIREHIKPTVPVTSHPDLVCALPLPPVKKPQGPPILGLTTRHIKHPKEYVLVAQVARKLMGQGWRVRHIIGGVGNHGMRDFENAKAMDVPGKEVVHTENLDKISRAIGECSLVISMKLHTTLVATMYGVPTISANPVVKARAFMDSVGRDEFSVASNDPRLEQLVMAGVPPVPMDRVNRIRDEASAAMRDLGQRLWTDFRASSPLRRALLPAAPQMP